MEEMTAEEQVEAIREDDQRYEPDAYYFLMHSMEWQHHQLGRAGHMKAHEVLDGICGFAHLQFGLMSRCVLEQWGIKQTDDVGEMVYNFVNRRFWGKTEDDSLEEFQGVFDLGKRLDDYEIDSSEMN